MKIFPPCFRPLIASFVVAVFATLLNAAEPKLGDADFPAAANSPRHSQKVAAVKSGDYDLVLIGDSITQFIGDSDGEWAPIKAVWAKYYESRKAINLGYSGYRTENILWNLRNGELEFKHSPKVFRLLIGTNNLDDQHYKTVHTSEQVFAGTKAIVDLIRSKFPEAKIIVLRILPSGGKNDKTTCKRVYCRSDKALQALRDAGAMTAKLADDKNVFWLDINHVFLKPDGTINADLMPDLIHPNAAGHEAMARAIEPLLARLMGDKPVMQKSVSPAKSLSSFAPIEAQGAWKAGTNLDGKPCNIGGIEYADGIGVDARSELKYSLDGHYRFFQAWVGLDLSQKGGMVRFQVFTDGQLAFDTGTVLHGCQGMNPNTNPHRAIGCRVPVAGIHELKLRVTGEAGINADWADARLWETAIPLSDPARFSNPSHRSATPPMGWNSWCGYGTGVNDAAVRRNADGMVGSGMKDQGYQYVIIDDWWSLHARDKDGNLAPDPQRFPEGIKALADYVHSKGLKFGMYTDAKSITCGGFPGSYGHYEQDAALFAKWGVDFLKVDWGGGQDAAKLYSDFGAALARERIVFNICEWGKNRPWTWARQAGGQMWRTTYDLIDRWDTDNDTNWGNGIVRIVDQTECLGEAAGPGGWNDLDQLFAGLYGQSWQSGAKKKSNDPKCPGCSAAEYRSQMSLWCLLSAPLIAGCDLVDMDSATRETLTNAEAIAVDQDSLGVPAWRARKLEQLEVWQKPLANGDIAVGVFNRGGSPQTVTVAWKCLGIAGEWDVRDLWAHKKLGSFKESYAREVAAHEVILLRLSNSGGATR